MPFDSPADAATRSMPSPAPKASVAPAVPAPVVAPVNLDPYGYYDATRKVEKDRSASAAAREAVDQSQLKLTAPPPQQAPTDPLQAFGQPAMWLAIFGSLASRQPFVNAINAAGAVLKSTRDQDATIVRQNYETWKINNENALKTVKTHLDMYKATMTQEANDRKGQEAAIRLAVGAMKDPVGMQLAMAGDFAGAAKHLEMVGKKTGQLSDASRDMEQAQLKHIIETGAATQAEVERYHVLQEANEIAKERKAGQAGAVAEAREKAGEIPRTPEQDASAAAQGATGEPLTQIVPGYGKSASDARERVRKLTVEKIQADTGMTPEQAGIELSKRTVMWMAKKGGALQLEKMVGATDQAVAQLDFNIDKTKEEIKKLSSSDLSPVINAIIRGEQKWTGNPEYTGLFFYMYATTMESARIMSGGAASIAQLHQGAAEEARKIANVGMTPASFDVAAKSMKEEGAARLRTYREAVTGMLPEASSAPTSGAPQATPTSPKPEKYPDAVWDAKEGAWTTIFNKKKYRVKPE